LSDLNHKLKKLINVAYRNGEMANGTKGAPLRPQGRWHEPELSRAGPGRAAKALAGAQDCVFGLVLAVPVLGDFNSI
jgi:hypothetical protein